MGRSLSRKEAKVKAANYCAYQERTQQQVRDKLYEYGLYKDEVEEVLTELITEGFVNEERFAVSFAGGKFRMKKWGKIKIKYALRGLHISEYCIRKGLEEIDEDEYLETLKVLINKKKSSLTDSDPYVVSKKIAAYIIQKGYEPDLVWSVINDLN